MFWDSDMGQKAKAKEPSLYSAQKNHPSVLAKEQDKRTVPLSCALSCNHN